MTATNPEGTVVRRDPGWKELFDFEIKFGENLELKNKNKNTEKKLEKFDDPASGRKQERQYGEML